MGDDHERRRRQQGRRRVRITTDDTSNQLPLEWALPKRCPIIPELAHDFSKPKFDEARAQVGMDGQAIEVNLAGGPKLPAAADT